MKKLLLAASFIAMPLYIAAQTAQAIPSAQALPAAPEPTGKLLRTTLECDVPRLMVTVTDDERGDLDLIPNNAAVLKAGAKYGKLGCRVGIWQTDPDETKAVITQCADIQAFCYSEKWGLDVYLQRYDGFYASRDGVDGESPFPSMDMRTATLNAYAKLGGSRTIRAFEDAITSDKGASILTYALASVSYRTVASPNAIPSPGTGTSPDAAAPQNAVTGDIIDALDDFGVVIPSVSAGFLAPLHAGPFFLNFGLSAGFGYPVAIRDTTVDEKWTVKVNAKVRTGFEGKRFFAGLLIVNDADAVRVDGGRSLQFQSATANLYAGWKFGPYGKVTR